VNVKNIESKLEESFMNGIAKKIMIYSLAGIMQIGLGATVVAASSLQNEGPQRIVQLDDRQRDRNDRQREHDDRQSQENDRHNREMQRHDNENDRDWHERQDRENERHDNTMHEIEAGLIGIVIGTIISK
jgi:hypothetical protein